MKHRVLVLGAGYAGTFAAGNLARRLSPADVEITVVNAEPDFVERMRLHQLAAGRHSRTRRLADLFAGTGIRLRLARVTGVDPGRRTVSVTEPGGVGVELGYDTLLYTLGSSVAGREVPGVAEHAFDVVARPSALRLRQRLADLGGGGNVLVVGEGLTGIEAATEIAEARPDLSVALAARGEPGDWLSPRARDHLLRTFDRLGISVHEHTPVTAVEPTRVIAADGTRLPSEATVWATGFDVQPLAGDGGLEVDRIGRIVVDAHLRSRSHPEVYAAGDSAHAVGEHGRPLPMSCFTAGVTARQAATAIVGDLTGRRVTGALPAYVGNCFSLGQRDGILQLVDGDEQPKSWSLRGRTAARIKAGVLRGTVWNASHPTAGRPGRRRRLAVAPARPADRPADRRVGEATA